MSRTASSLGFAVFLALTACRPAEQPREDWSGFGPLENVLNWTPEQQLRGYRHIDRIYPTRAIPASQRPFPLPDKPADFSSFRYAVGSENYDVDDFVAHNHVVGLLAIHDGSVALGCCNRHLDRTRYLLLELCLGHCRGLARPVGEILVDALIG